MDREMGVNYLTDVRPRENPYHHWPKSSGDVWEKGEKEVNRNLESVDLRKELEFAKERLAANAVRVAGHSIEEGMVVAKAAREAGLTPWLSPRFHGATFVETSQMLAAYTRRAVAEGLSESPLIVANELPYDCANDPITSEVVEDGSERVSGIVEKYLKKGMRIDSTERVAHLMGKAREAGWKGPLVYAQLFDERVDWEKIPDKNVIVGVNLYWGKNYDENRPLTSEEYEARLQQMIREAGGRKLVLTEFGSVPQTEGSGGGGYKKTGVLDYKAQADAYRRYLEVISRNDVGYFAFALDEPEKEYQQRHHQSYAIALRRHEGADPLQLTAGGEVFAEYNRRLSGTHGIIKEE